MQVTFKFIIFYLSICLFCSCDAVKDRVYSNKKKLQNSSWNVDEAHINGTQIPLIPIGSHRSDQHSDIGFSKSGELGFGEISLWMLEPHKNLTRIRGNWTLTGNTYIAIALTDSGYPGIQLATPVVILWKILDLKFKDRLIVQENIGGDLYEYDMVYHENKLQ